MTLRMYIIHIGQVNEFIEYQVALEVNKTNLIVQSIVYRFNENSEYVIFLSSLPTIGY